MRGSSRASACTRFDALWTLYRRFSDLSPSPGDPSICDRISAGIELEAVRVFVPWSP